ncbi:MAG TPA: tetratricopeptide repeat protein [Blastocatellia bacterium]|nr:tetratricopeptide repeat protein [Blastocatellia bacterium]
MRLDEALSFLRGEHQEDGASHCPDEADVLAYLAKTHSGRNRARMERHFNICDNCRETLALYVRIPGDQLDGASFAEADEQTVTSQAARVRAMIAEDEFNRRRVRTGAQAGADVVGAGGMSWTGMNPARLIIRRSFLQLAAAAVVFLVVAVGGVILLTRGPSREEVANKAVARLMSAPRRSEGRISGFPWARLEIQRGENDRGESEYKLARNTLSYAEDRSAPAAERRNLARAYLAHGNVDDSTRALTILRDLAEDGVASAEVFNDTGVALMQLRNYKEAIPEFNKALEKDPKYEEALFNRALAKQRANMLTEAAQDWNQFISATKNDDWKREAETRLREIDPFSGR